MSRPLLPGDRVIVVNRMSSLMGEAGEVKTVQPRVVRVLLDCDAGDDTEGVVFHRDELERLP